MRSIHSPRQVIFFETYLYRDKPKRRYFVKTVCGMCKKECNAHISNFRKSKKSYCSKQCAVRSRMGENNYNWIGGRKKKSSGHILIYAPNHPFAKKNFVPEHRLVLEKKLGRFLTKKEVVHHIDCVKDNNDEENLIAMSNQKHNKAHGSLESCVAELIKRKILIFDKSILLYKVT